MIKTLSVVVLVALFLAQLALSSANPCPAGLDVAFHYDQLKTSDLSKSASWAAGNCYSWQTMLAIAPKLNSDEFINKFSLIGWQDSSSRPSCSAQASKANELTEIDPEATGQTLYTPDGKHRVWYEVFFNQAQVDTLTHNGAYTEVSPHNWRFSGFPATSVELKLAWVPASAVNNSDRYVTKEIEVSAGSSCARILASLVGLHVVRRTENYPGWIWSSFEHIDNAPNIADLLKNNGHSERWTFFDLQRDPTPNLSVGYANMGAGEHDDITQVIRMLDISALDGINSYWQPKAAGPWPNYFLVGTQVSTTSTGEAPEKPQGATKNQWANSRYLSNTTLETAIQANVTKKTNSGCIQCHAGSNKTATAQNPPWFTCNQSIAGTRVIQAMVKKLDPAYESIDCP